ncbi:MAG: SUMF1/EgtB/PvdO family nonheme iron enzyme, partial [Saprospiraceae bacterium]
VLENPNATQIEEKLKDYSDRFARNLNGLYPENGQLFIFFSGHGVEDLENGYFLPGGADPKRLRETALPYVILRPLINAIKCRHILVAVDACYSVYFDENFDKKTDFTFRRPGEGDENARILANHEKFRSRLFFTSDAVGDMTPDKSGFARKLLEGFRSAPSPNGFITSSELFAGYVQKAQPVPHGGVFGDDDPSSTFLFFYAQASTPIVSDGDSKAWTDAKTVNSLESYRNYLRNFPQGEFRELAAKNIQGLEEKERDAADWQRAKSANTRESYEQYIKVWPSGDYLDLAETARKNLLPLSPDNVVAIYGSTFLMGSNWADDERPAHSVTLNSYYIGKYEVTVRQFKEFIDASRYKTDAEKEGMSVIFNDAGGVEVKSGVNWRHDAQGNLRPDSDYNHPVIHVSWNDAMEFCKWLSQKTGRNYRLPTEAEWEFAAGNGSKHTTYSWGNGEPIGKQGGNIADKSLRNRFPNFVFDETYYDGYPFTSPVGSFNPNEFGLYDMSGNVMEWCLDWYAPDYYANSPSSNPRGPSTGSSRAFRGGSWNTSYENCRVTVRNDNFPGTTSLRCYFIGFRLLRTF